MPRPKILIVDDEPSILESTQMLLDVLGYDSVVVREAERVLEAARRERPDLILQDLKMPGLDPVSLVAGLRGQPATSPIPIAFFSASPTLPETAARLDAAGYLTKPFREEELLGLLRRTLPLKVNLGELS